ncbi:hypothetical protein BJY59DRAFT_443491 [Rhodotorula toruloides]
MDKYKVHWRFQGADGREEGGGTFLVQDDVSLLIVGGSEPITTPGPSVGSLQEGDELVWELRTITVESVLERARPSSATLTCTLACFDGMHSGPTRVFSQPRMAPRSLRKRPCILSSLLPQSLPERGWTTPCGTRTTTRCSIVPWLVRSLRTCDTRNRKSTSGTTSSFMVVRSQTTERRL